MTIEPTSATEPAPTFDAVPPPYAPEAPAETTAAEPLPEPRIRWAGVVWGSLFAVLASMALVTLADPARRAAARDAIVGLAELHVPPAVIVAISVLVMGGFLAVIGVTALTRRARLTTEG